MESKKLKHGLHQERETIKEPAKLTLALTNQLGKKDTLKAILDNYHSWLPRYQEFSQGRSNFQIEKMVATEHATPAASFQHTLYQLRVLHQSLMQDIVRGIERTREMDYKWKNKSHDEPQWWEMEQGGKKLTWYDTDSLQFEHEMEELKMSVKDKLLQMDTFIKVLKSMEEKHGGRFTQKELNDEEPEYWKLRLARQMSDEYLDRQTGLGTGNIKSLRMGLSESPLVDSKNQITEFPDIFNAVLGGREQAMRVINDVNEKLFRGMNTLGANKPELPKSEPKKVSESQSKTGLQNLESMGITLSDLED